MKAGRVTSKALLQADLARINAFDRRGAAINAIISLNPGALDEAEALDRERASRGPRDGRRRRRFARMTKSSIGTYKNG